MLSSYILNMTCGGCAGSVTEALLTVEPQARIETNPPTGKVWLERALDKSASDAGVPNNQGPEAKRER
jgi:copper chaperone